MYFLLFAGFWNLVRSNILRIDIERLQRIFYIFFFGAFGVIYDLMWRLWMYYYDVCWDNEIDKTEWDFLINGKNTSNDDEIPFDTKHWFIAHRATWGNII